MNRHARIVAGSALALLMTSASSFALTHNAGTVVATPGKTWLMAQAEGDAPAEAAPEPLPQQQAPAEDAQPAPEPEAAPVPAPEPEAAPAPEPEPQAEPAPAPEPEAAPAPEPEPEAAPAPAPEPEAAPAPPPEPQVAPNPEPQPDPAPEPQPEPAPTPEPEAAPAPEPQAAPAPEPETAPAPEAQPVPAPEAQPAPEPDAAAPAPAPAPEPEAAPEPLPLPTPALPQPDADKADPAAPAPEPQAPANDNAPVRNPEPTAPDADAPAEIPAVPPGEALVPGKPGDRKPVRTEAPDDGAQAPVLDSQKQAPSPAQPPAADGTKAAQPAPLPPAAPAGPPPASEKAARQDQKPVEVKPVTAEEGVRVERAPDAPERRERPEGADVVRKFGDRLIIQFNNQTVVESNDRPRMSRGAKDVYYEDLPRGRSRETIVRPDGTRVVTIRDEYGDVIRRSRITPDDREYILSYVDEDSDTYERDRDWRDPGLDLPPMRLDIPEDEYIYEAEPDETAEGYYDFLDKPPVERVERSYSVDEVKRSARIRDKTRRVDLDTLTFEFGAATIPEDQIPRLQAVADAMEKMLAKNPAETFLIEGHTDAVGSDLANLALSDRRAEAVADALTNVFAIPPENLATQGYGEQFLKVRSQAAERTNRRVAIRRITPLVTPVVAAQ